MVEDQQRKQRQQMLSNQRTTSSQQNSGEYDNGRYPYWLHPDIIVKILNKRLSNGKYYKSKGVVERITGGGYIGEIRILEIREENENNNVRNEFERIRVDQEELETVIPQVTSINCFILFVLM